LIELFEKKDFKLKLPK